MQIIVPMSGIGERFKQAGYTLPKPLIKVEGKPIIEHVVDMFPEESDFTFICNNDHLNNSKLGLKKLLKKKSPSSKVLGIDSHRLGPVHAILQAKELIDPVEPVIVNYCDFSCYWDYKGFKKFISETQCEGAIPVYTGFHPHILRSVNFAYLKESNLGNVIDIQEKKPFTDNPMNEYASSGTYYFKTGNLLMEYAAKSLRKDLALKGEYYISMVYKPMLEDNLIVKKYEIEHFMQWGTPEDLYEYNYFSNMFRLLGDNLKQLNQKGSTMITMAGSGTRFLEKNYKDPKPLIPVSGKPMSIQATTFLPKSEKNIFILRKNSKDLESISNSLEIAFKNTSIVALEDKTEGQAVSALHGFENINPKLPLTIGPCDSGVIYNTELLKSLLADDEIDIIIWSARGYPGAIKEPENYGWISCNQDGFVNSVSVKKKPDDPISNPLITGIFTFKRAEMFKEAANLMIKRGRKVNGEYYIDSCINEAIELGKRVKIFDVDSFLCWGSPDDLQRFDYWQKCFSKWSGHPYTPTKDPMFK